MPNFVGRITGFAVGDDLLIRRTIDRAESGIPTGVLITDAWFTVKSAIADLDAAALVDKQITTSDVPGTGQIEDDGTADADPIVRFDLTDADTRLIGTAHRKYDIQVKTALGGIYTGEKGETWGEGDVTLDIA